MTGVVGLDEGIDGRWFAADLVSELLQAWFECYVVVVEFADLIVGELRDYQIFDLGITFQIGLVVLIYLIFRQVGWYSRWY